MSETDSDSAGPLDRLRRDLGRPAGGWTVGFGTLGGVLAALAASSLVHQWFTAVAVVLLLVHMMWGAAGYYPRMRVR